VVGAGEIGNFLVAMKWGEEGTTFSSRRAKEREEEIHHKQVGWPSDA